MGEGHHLLDPIAKSQIYGAAAAAAAAAATGDVVASSVAVVETGL